MKRVICFFVCMCVLLVSFNTVLLASSQINDFSLKYISIIKTSLNIERITKAKVNCWADLMVDYGNIAMITMELQKNDGTWQTIKKWENQCDSYVCIDEDWYVENEYQYRIKVMFEAYTKDMELIESETQYLVEI